MMNNKSDIHIVVGFEVAGKNYTKFINKYL